MTISVFLSYSHADESFKDEFRKHASSLRRNEIISAWDDREILAGQEWESEIITKLETAELILLMISPDFLDSDFCYDREMKRAVERHNSGSAIVIPIILKNCDWGDTPFAKLQGLPKDAKAISTWKDRDTAWLDVINGIKKSIEELKKKDNSLTKLALDTENIITDDHETWINDTEVEFNHRNKIKIILPDIYVAPDLKILRGDLDKISQTTSIKSLINDGKYLVFGDDQSGKTSLSKKLFASLLNSNYMPIVLNGTKIKSSNLKDIIKIELKRQYKPNHEALSNRKPAIIIDDFSEIKLNKKNIEKLVYKFKSEFDICILISSNTYQFIAQDVEELDDFSCYEIVPFGNLKRTEIIEKWVSLGREEIIEDNELYQLSDQIKLKIDSMVRKHIIPPKPIYILTLLQMFETYTPQKYDLTSHGHCYQYLVYQSFDKAKIRGDDIDKYLNVMTELAWFIFSNQKPKLNHSDLEEFFTTYEKNFLPVNRNEIVEVLIKIHILFQSDGLTSFKYKYIYYFFTAKRMAENFRSNNETKSAISKLLHNLHNEDCSNIIIFLTHHTKDQWVLDEIQITLMELFQEQEPSRLDSESLGFMNEFIKEIPALIIEKRKIKEEREAHDKKMDEIEKPNPLHEEYIDELEPSDTLAQINKTFRGIEIAGQIVRNRHASLKRNDLYSLAHEGINTGLRFLDYFLGIANKSKYEVIKIIETILKENPSLTNQQIEKEAKNAFLFLTYGVIFGVIRKISTSMGSSEAEAIYREIEKDFNTNSINLINQAIDLHFHKKLDFRNIEFLNDKFSSNPTCARILREIIIQHIYMFPVSYQDKQRISNTLRISMDTQRILDQKKQLKY